MNESLATLITEISYPITNWGFESKQEYLDHTLNLLKHLNSVSSSIAHLKQDHLQLLHALNVLNSSPSRAEGLFRMMDCTWPETREEMSFPALENGKEWVVRRALLGVRWVSYLVFEIIGSSLGGALRMVKAGCGGDFKWWDGLMDLQRGCYYEELGKKRIMGKGGLMLEEGSAVNNCVVELLEVMNEEKGGNLEMVGVELRKRVEEVGGWLDGIEEIVERFFGGVLRVRNELVDGVTIA